MLTESAFTTTYVSDYPRLKRWLLRFLYPDHRTYVEDFAQTAFLKAWEHRDEYRGECSVFTYICQIARNSYLQWLRTSAVRSEITFADVPEQSLTPDYDASILLDALLLNCTATQSQAVMLLHIDGYSLREAASMQGVTESAIKLTTYRARLRMRYGRLQGERRNKRKPFQIARP